MLRIQSPGLRPQIQAGLASPTLFVGFTTLRSLFEAYLPGTYKDKTKIFCVTVAQFDTPHLTDGLSFQTYDISYLKSNIKTLNISKMLQTLFF